MKYTIHLVAIVAALTLAAGTIFGTAFAEICSEQVGNTVSCFIQEGSLVVEKVGGAQVTVTEGVNTTVVDIVPGNVTVPEEPGVFPGPEDPDIGEPMVVPEEPVEEEPMVVPEEPVKEDEMVVN
jgi:hypothetical protein